MKTPQIIMAAAICILCASAMVTSVLGQSELQTSSNQQAAIVEMSQPTIEVNQIATPTTTEVATGTIDSIDTDTSSSTYDTQTTDTIPQ